MSRNVDMDHARAMHIWRDSYLKEEIQLTMPKAKTILVQGENYQYTLKGPKGRNQEGTGKTIRLIMELETQRVAVTFESKKWTQNHEDDMPTSIHKNSFTPADVVNTVSHLLFNGDKVSGIIDLLNWKSCGQSITKVGQSKTRSATR